MDLITLLGFPRVFPINFAMLMAERRLDLEPNPRSPAPPLAATFDLPSLFFGLPLRRSTFPDNGTVTVPIPILLGLPRPLLLPIVPDIILGSREEFSDGVSTA